MTSCGYQREPRDRRSSLRVLVTGATGLIGSAVVARLLSASHEVVAVVRRRDRAARRLATPRIVELDIAQATLPQVWLPYLRGVEAVVNCAGVLQDSIRDDTSGVHHAGAAALFAACELAGIRRVVQISALGVGERDLTEFSRSKLAGDQSLMARDLNWVVLRPSVVVGRAAYGGSALFRGLAALPVLPLAPDTGPLQIVQLDELVHMIVFCLSEAGPAKRVFEIAGPRRYSLLEVVQTYRRWLGFAPAKLVPLPRALASVVYRVGDLLALLGWRTPIRSTAKSEILRGAVSDRQEWNALLKFVPRSLETALAEEPASVQETWFAQLYFLKPVVIGALCWYWVLIGLISVGPGYLQARNLLGFTNGLAEPLVVAGSIVDISVGVLIAVRKTTRLALLSALAISAFYLLCGTFLVPRLWTDPLGPLLKILPIMVLNFVALAIVDER